MGTQLPLPEGAQLPIFRQYLLQPNGSMDQDLTWLEVGLGPGDFVLDGDPAPPPQKGGRAPKFSAHVYCAKTAGWIKMVLGMEAGLRPGDCVRWGPSPPP